VIGSLAAMTVGCQTVLPPKTQPVALMEEQRPLVIDDATQLRDFEKSTVYYPSSATQAGSTRFPFAARSNAPKVERAFVEPALFLANVVALPFTLFIKPPGTSYDWHAEVTGPSYTVQPAYPAEATATGSPTQDRAAGEAGTPGGPVPEAQSPVPSVSEPVRDPSGVQPNLPTENQGPNEIPGTPADSSPQPSAPPSGATGGANGAGGATGGGQ